MAKSRIKGQNINILENEINNRYYRNRENRGANYRNNFETRGERGEKEQQRQNQYYNYERQNNLRRELQNTQASPKFKPRYAKANTRYFYNNQRFQNTRKHEVMMNHKIK